jgi:hypothetical protein
MTQLKDGNPACEWLEPLVTFYRRQHLCVHALPYPLLTRTAMRLLTHPMKNGEGYLHNDSSHLLPNEAWHQPQIQLLAGNWTSRFQPADLSDQSLPSSKLELFTDWSNFMDQGKCGAGNAAKTL